MRFTRILLTSPICHINAAGAGTGLGGAATYAAVTALTPAQAVAAAAVTINAANQALVAQSAAAAVVLAATLPTEFNSNNLPPAAKTRYENHLDPSYLMTKSDMHLYPTLTGECVLFCLTLIHQWVAVSLASLIRTASFLRTANSSP